MLTQTDFLILNAIQTMRNSFLDLFMPIITYLGSGGAIWILAALVLLRFKKSRKAGFTVLLALLIGYILSTVILKDIVARERPFNTAGAMLRAEDLLIGVPSGRFSFPSGHALSSFSAAAILFAYDRKIGIPSLILASLIAFSRLYLYVHFLSDVLFGAVLGVLFAVLSIKIVNWIWRKTNERKLSDNS